MIHYCHLQDAKVSKSAVDAFKNVPPEARQGEEGQEKVPAVGEERVSQPCASSHGGRVQPQTGFQGRSLSQEERESSVKAGGGKVQAAVVIQAVVARRRVVTHSGRLPAALTRSAAAGSRRWSGGRQEGPKNAASVPFLILILLVLIIILFLVVVLLLILLVVLFLVLTVVVRSKLALPLHAVPPVAPAARGASQQPGPFEEGRLAQRAAE